jgi:glycosyltransferase involved in cell wall biosynthesis
MKASVMLITYNHEKYIAQAIEGALMQKTDFPYEVVVGEDCSTDGTREIVIDYQHKYPDQVRLLPSERNLGGRENAKRTRQACQGQYVAILDGDDYWTDPHKLQKQVDFLDENPGFALCFHNVAVVDENSKPLPRLYCPASQKTISTLEDLLYANFIPTCATLFRGRLAGNEPDWFWTMPMGDWPFLILLAQHGQIGYLNEVMGVYRRHGGGVFTSRSNDRRFDESVRLYEAISLHFEHRYDAIIADAKRRQMAAWAVEKVKAADSFEEGIAVTHRTLNRWLKAYALPKAWRSKALGQVYAYYLFSCRSGQVDRRTARHCFIRMACHDPSWLRNAGVWSIGAEVFLGRPASSWLRRQYRSTNGRHGTTSEDSPGFTAGQTRGDEKPRA